MPIELRHLRYFSAVAEELSFTAAAERLRISQPPLSQQIHDLEDMLGTPLFQRTSRRVSLTAAGDAFLVHARAILAQIEIARLEAQTIAAGKIGKIFAGATGSILRGGLADLLAAYRHEYPEVITTLIEQSPALQIRALLERRTDISFIRTPPASDGLIAELAWREDVMLAMSRIHRLAKHPRLTLKDLHDEEFVTLAPESSDFARSILESCVAAGFLPRVAHEVVDAQSILGLISAGFGVALVPASISRFTSNEILFRPLAASISADVYLVYRDENNSPALQTFIGFARRFSGLGKWHVPSPKTRGARRVKT
jgi:DNA-binding transcriptional LysR family regulator